MITSGSFQFGQPLRDPILIAVICFIVAIAASKRPHVIILCIAGVLVICGLICLRR